MASRLIAFSQAKAANLLVAYLIGQGIQAEMRNVPNTQSEAEHSRTGTESPSEQHDAQIHANFQVYILHEADLAAAKGIAQDFLSNPNQTKFQQSAWDLGAIDTSAQGGSSINMQDALQAVRLQPVTLGVTALCVLIYLLSLLGYFPLIDGLIGIRSLNELTQTHQWWRILGPNFLHFSFMHIAFNLVWWWMLGGQLERSFGRVALVVFFVLASVSSNIAQLLVSGPNFGGMSGVVYALVGFVWWIGFLRPQWLISLPKNIIYFLLGWLVIGYFDVLWVNMANEAHTFGLISGCVMALLMHMFAAKKPQA